MVEIHSRSPQDVVPSDNMLHPLLLSSHAKARLKFRNGKVAQAVERGKENQQNKQHNSQMARLPLFSTRRGITRDFLYVFHLHPTFNSARPCHHAAWQLCLARPIYHHSSRPLTVEMRILHNCFTICMHNVLTFYPVSAFRSLCWSRLSLS